MRLSLLALAGLLMLVFSVALAGMPGSPGLGVVRAGYGTGSGEPELLSLQSVASSPVGSPVTVTALVTDSAGDPVSGVTVGFDVLSGPDAAAGVTASSDTTGSSGTAAMVLPGDTGGTDVVEAFFDDKDGHAIKASASVSFGLQPGDLTAKAKGLSVEEGKSVKLTKALAKFSDPDGSGLTAASFTARIDWGDQNFYSTPASVIASKAGFEVEPSSPHMFCSTGTRQFAVTIVEPADHESTVVSGMLTVKASPLHDDNCATGGLVFTPKVNGQTPACTASVVSRTGTTAVLITAAHCFGDYLNPDGSISAQSYIFVPAGKPQEGAEAPFGVWSGTIAFVDPHFGIEHDRYYDFALIGLNLGCDTSSVNGQCPIGLLTAAIGGGLPIRWYPPQSGTLTASNLPWIAYAQLSKPRSCSTASGGLFSTQEGSGQQWVIQPCNMQENDWPISGAPFIDATNALSAVLSSTGKESVFGPRVVRGTYMGPEAKSDFEFFTASLP